MSELIQQTDAIQVTKPKAEIKILPYDLNTGISSPFYHPEGDYYGTYTFPEIVIKPQYKDDKERQTAMNNAEGKKGGKYVRNAIHNYAFPIAAPIVAGAALPAMGATGFGTALKGTLATVEPVLDAVDTGISLSTGDYFGTVSNFLPYDKIGTLFNKLIQHGYYVPKTKKFLKEGLDRALKEGVITADEYKDLQKIKIKTDYSGNFHNLGGDGIAIAPKYKGQDGGFSLFHELGHEIEARRLKNSDDFMEELARTFATHGKDYKYGDVTDLDRLQSELFADRFAFNLAGSKSLNFSKDVSNPDLIYRFKHYLRNIDWDNEYTAAIKNGDLLKAQELRNLHFLHVSGKPISQKLFRDTHNPSRTSFATKKAEQNKQNRKR